MKIKQIIVFTLILMLTISTLTLGVEGKEKNKNNIKVKPGIEVFLEKHIDWVEGKRVGLITNPTGINTNLVSSADLMFQHPDINLTAMFGPEHGIRGDQEAGEYIESYIDEETGLPVYSLYGPTWKPTADMLENVDVLVFDIQDIGSNVYTYIYTMGFAMEAAAEFDKELIILDRPNAIGGERVEGPLRSADTVSFMGRFLLPVRHGMTIGELAVMWNHEYSMGVNLKVAKMEGWKRDMHFKDTGLPWVMTSPNIPTEETAYLYAGTELLDNTSLSVGLGTTKPFQLVGAPWIDGEALAKELKERDISGVNFRSAYFTPQFGAFVGQRVGGVEVHIENPQEIDLVKLGLELLDAMKDQNPEKFEIRANYDELIGNTAVRDQILADVPVDVIMAGWEDELQSWIKEVRNHYLLYPPFKKGSKPYKEKSVVGILPLDLNLGLGESQELTVKGFDKNNKPIDLNTDDLKWEVTNNIGYIENGVFTSTNVGEGTIKLSYGKQTFTRDVSIGENIIQNIRYGVHADYTRLVVDLNRTINYQLTEKDNQLTISIPYGEISGSLNPQGGQINVDGSPVVEKIDYYIEDGIFKAEVSLIKDNVTYQKPTFSNRIVIDVIH